MNDIKGPVILEKWWVQVTMQHNLFVSPEGAALFISYSVMQ